MAACAAVPNQPTVPNRLVEPASGRADPRRKILLDLFRAALESVDGRLCVANALRAVEDGAAAGAGAAPSGRPVWAAAVGKAASAMLLGAHDALGATLTRSLVITKDDHVAPQCYTLPGAEVLESAHPMPDERSLAAGERLLQWVDEFRPIRMCCSSSRVAHRVSSRRSCRCHLEQLTALNARGLASGMTIVELNAQRAKLSQIKGGRLAARVSAKLAGSGTARALFISDVPGHDPAVIGSGLMGPSGAGDPSSAASSPPSIMRWSASSPKPTTRSARRDPRIFEGSADRLAVRFCAELHMSVNPALRVGRRIHRAAAGKSGAGRAQSAPGAGRGAHHRATRTCCCSSPAPMERMA